MKITPTMGNYCRAVAMSTVMNYYGYHLSEAMCFGIGEAFDFCGSDVRFGKNKIYKCFSGNNENDIFCFSNHMQVNIQVIRPKCKKETIEVINDYIEQSKPIIARVSINKYMDLLPGMTADNQEIMKSIFRIINGSAGNHVTVISNSGKDKVMIHEPNLSSAVILPWKRLLEAMNPNNASIRHPSNTIYIMMPSISAEEMETEENMCPIIWNAIQNNMKNYLYTEGSWSGLKQIELYGKTLLNGEINNDFEKDAILFRFFCDIVTGGGFYRRLYGRFLQEANQKYLHDEIIDEVSKKYFVLSRKWSKLSKKTVEYSVKAANKCKSELEQEWTEICMLEKENAEKLYIRSLSV